MRLLCSAACHPPTDHERLDAAFAQLEACYANTDSDCRAEEGLADARFHLAIAEASHNVVLLHTIRGLFDLLRGNVVTNIGGMYNQRSETRTMLIEQHRALHQAIKLGRLNKHASCPISTLNMSVKY